MLNHARQQAPKEFDWPEGIWLEDVKVWATDKPWKPQRQNNGKTLGKQSKHNKKRAS